MNKDTKANLLNADTWIRLLYMILFALLLVLARVVILTIALLQFLLVLFNGEANSQLVLLGQGTAKWAYRAFLFLTYNSEDKPYPFADWPETEIVLPVSADDAEEAAVSTVAPSSDDVPSFVTPQPHPGSDAGDQGADKG
ncbi:DUF4389 domain-containing protein [Porticoccus sp.]